MVSSIGSIGSINSAYNVYGAQPLTPQTKAQLEALGINTTNITTEAQGQAALKASQGSQQAQNTQQAQAPHHRGGGNSAIKALVEEALALAQKVGASVSSNAKLDEILDAIADALSKMQADAANDPKKAALFAQYQAEYLSLCQSAETLKASMEASHNQAVSAAGMMQSSMDGLASYNMASISISNSDKLKS